MNSFQNMKFLICTHVFPPDNGGISAFARDLVELFRSGRAGVDVFISRKRRKKGRLISLLYNFKEFKNIARQVLYNRYDFIIATRMLPLGICLALMKPFIKAGVIIQVHGTEIEGRYKRSFWRKRLLRFTYNSVDQIWANSNNTINRLAKFGVTRDKIKLVYPFLTSDIAGIDLNQLQKDRTIPIRIFTAANLYPRKGVDLVLKALSCLKEQNWHYYIAGRVVQDNDNTYLKMAEDLGIRDKVTFYGQLRRTDVWKQMAQADVFVLTSRAMPDDIESFGIVYMEAQYFGVPCIGTNIGGIPEAVGNGGYLIENGDISQLVFYLKKLINDKVERDRLAETASMRIKDKFLMERRREEICKYLGGIRR